MSFNIEVEGGKSVRLPTAGKYCDRDIVVTATGGGGGSYDQGYADGKQDEYDRFWDVYQDNGNRTDYRCAFGGFGWTDETFRPKHKIQPVQANNMFFYCQTTDMKKTLADCGVTLDLSKCTEFTHWFSYCASSTLGVVDTTSAVNLQYLFAQRNYLVSIDCVILRNDGSQTGLSTAFQELRELENVHFEGEFGESVSFARSSKLSMESVDDIIAHLRDYMYHDDAGRGTTLTLHKDVGAKLTDDELRIAWDKNWSVVY